ncbi:hypothetical protein BDR04DRAFT_1154341 [Suillus decipiens]|nr:hypothetical protein BDR04DRAFT_1154341 [Suillus decipiens]
MPFLASRMHMRKSDVENERLSSELFDAEEAKAFLAQAQSGSLPMTPAYIMESCVSCLPNGGQMGSLRTPFKGRHGRQALLGTTMTSPSTRRRSLESTISMIQEALDGKDLETRGLPGNGSSYWGGSGSSSHT